MPLMRLIRVGDPGPESALYGCLRWSMLQNCCSGRRAVAVFGSEVTADRAAAEVTRVRRGRRGRRGRSMACIGALRVDEPPEG